MDKDLRGYMAELVGTFSVVFISAATVCAGYALTGDPPRPHPNLVGIALAYGFAFAVSLAAVLPFSQGYLNPAVTITLWACKRLDGAKTCWLIFVQLLGAALAGGLIRLFLPIVPFIGQARMGTPHLNLDTFSVRSLDLWSKLGGVGIEAGLTFVLTFVIFATLVDSRAPRVLGATGRWLAGLWAGLTVAAAVFPAYPITGAALNPARWFGTVVWESTVPSLAMTSPWADNMIYWIGPILGAVLAGGVYTLLILPAEDEQLAAETAPAGGKVAAGAGSTLFRAKR